MKMRSVAATAIVVVLMAAGLAAGNAHFVWVKIAIGDTVTASGKVAGLGDVPQIHVTLTADARCVNRGGNKPSAGNKQTFSVDGDFPVQNGRAMFISDLDATFQPPCNPP